jgi:hypothetical protein
VLWRYYASHEQSIKIRGAEDGASKPMNSDAKIEQYHALKLGYLPITALTIRHSVPPTGWAQSLIVELQKGEQTVAITFIGLRQLRIADLHPGSHCLLDVLSVASDQWEGIRYRGFNIEQDLTLAFYCADFEISALSSVSGADE